MKLCFIGIGASHYRRNIFKLIDETFTIDWVFGDIAGDIKPMDTSILSGNVEIVKNIYFFSGKAYWQKNVVKHLFMNYTHYLMSGDERCLSTWVILFISLFMPKKKVYLWGHGPYGKEGRIKRFAEYIFHSMTDGEFLYSNYSRNILIERRICPQKLFTIHNSLDYDKQLILRNSGLSSCLYKEHFNNSYPVLLFIGRLTKVKKLYQLIDAVAMLHKTGNFFNIVLVGDGSERDSLYQQVERLKLSSYVWFYGACYDEKTNAELVYNADLCVAPGNVGLTAMHTMMFGTPVVSHNNYPWQMPEFEAIKEGETGAFFKEGDSASLADTIREWFEVHKSDREKVRMTCYKEIDEQWNPKFQIDVLKKGLNEL